MFNVNFVLDDGHRKLAKQWEFIVFPITDGFANSVMKYKDVKLHNAFLEKAWTENIQVVAELRNPNR